MKGAEKKSGAYLHLFSGELKTFSSQILFLSLWNREAGSPIHHLVISPESQPLSHRPSTFG